MILLRNVHFIYEIACLLSEKIPWILQKIIFIALIIIPKLIYNYSWKTERKLIRNINGTLMMLLIARVK